MVDTLAASFDALLLDLDGTVWEGGRALPRAVEEVQRFPGAALFVTNNASRSPAETAAKLNGIGLDAAARQVVTSAEAAVDLARERLGAGATALILGADSFTELAREAGLVPVVSADDRPACVLHGHNPRTGWAELSEAALAITQGALYIASNLDSTLPNERGLMVGNGSMVAAVTHATGVVPLAAGKPEPTLFSMAVARCGAQAPLAVGDRLNTDIRGGNAAGIPTLHVLTGVSREMDLVRAIPEERPTFIGADLAALRLSPAALRPGAQGGFSAEIEENYVVLSGGDHPDSMSALRTVLAAAWGGEEASEGESHPVTAVLPRGPIAAEAIEGWR